MGLRDMIVPNEDFQTSVNIDYDFGSKAMVEGLIPTDSVCRYLEEILRDVVLPSNQRAKLLVGAYGKGKSHVVLAALTAMWVKDPASFQRIVEAYRDRRLGFADTLGEFVTKGRCLLPVIISGSTSDLRHSLLHALRNALRLAELEELMPTTNYDGAIEVLDRWARDYPDTLRRFEELTGHSAASVESRLRSMDTAAYETFSEAYPELTSGGSFNALDGAEVIEVYEHVLDGLSGRGVDGIYVVYDEFSKYLETSLDRATFEDTKLLQDFAEACNRSIEDKQLHLLLISHKSLSNYIDSNLPKEKVDGWRGVSGRFREIEMADDARQCYELLSNAITKDEVLWKKWLTARNGANDRKLRRMGTRYVGQGLFEAGDAEMVTHGCFPLHPLTSYLLARMSERVAQNERTLFTFVCSEEENSLRDAMEESDGLVAPDYVYAYFEPLLRREYYTSPFHRVYELARSSMGRVDPGGLECRIIRTIAAIDVVAQYDRVAPTRQTIIDLYTDCGYEPFEVDEALDNLVANDSVVYLRRSNAFLKLKETSGVRVDSEVSDRAERLRSTIPLTDILNREMRGRALYPSRYNEDRRMVRYFDCGFASARSLNGQQLDDTILGGGGDGEVVAICAEGPDELRELKDLAKNKLSKRPMTVIVFPRRYTDIASAAYRLEAARQLEREAEGDAVLVEEYDIVFEDYAEIVDDFIAGYFQPELGRSLYYIGTSQKKRITRKRRLSEELSRLCDETYRNTPRITSEALNKNELTGTAFGSRTKILKALCAKHLEPNLGFVGNGQETSMARSAFERTGLIRNLETAVDEAGESHEPGIDLVIDTIRDFVEGAQESSFATLRARLTGRELGIGLREGPMPLYLAYVLRDYRDEIKITRDGEERPFSETTLDDISRQPERYTLTRLNWTPQMAAYVDELANLFGCRTGTPTRNDVADALRLWYVELPQVTRNSRSDHTRSGNVAIPKVRAAFFNALRRIEMDSNVLLFEVIPKVFGTDLESGGLLQAVRAEKEECDAYLAEATDRLSLELISMFDSGAHGEATLGSVLRDWVERNPAVSTHVFSGVNNQVINAIRAANGDDRVTVNRLAKAATSLRIDDWNDARFGDFLRIVQSAKSEAEGIAGREGSSSGGNAISLTFVGSDGVARQKTFDAVECGPRARILKNSIVASLAEMGGALAPEEKRQVVFEVLEGLC